MRLGRWARQAPPSCTASPVSRASCTACQAATPESRESVASDRHKPDTKAHVLLIRCWPLPCHSWSYTSQLAQTHGQGTRHAAIRFCCSRMPKAAGLARRCLGGAQTARIQPAQGGLHRACRQLKGRALLQEGPQTGQAADRRHALLAAVPWALSRSGSGCVASWTQKRSCSSCQTSL